MKLHEAIAKYLVDDAVDTLFGLVGDANLFILDSFEQYGGRYVSLLHEANAVVAGLGYASVTGRIGVASVTHGPGLTNTVTALAEGVRARLPLVLIAGDTPIADTQHFQDIPQREVVAASGAGFVQARTPETTLLNLAEAFRRARYESRPIVLNLPSEFQWAEVEYHPPVSSPTQGRVVPSRDELESAVGIIAAARRPIVLAGRGALGSRDQVLAFAKRIGAPLTTSVRGMDLFHDEPLNMGVFGGVAHDLATEVIAGSDCIVSFGAGLNRRTTEDGALLAGRSVVQVDVDSRVLGRYAQVTVGVHGDAGLAADGLVNLLDVAEVPASSYGSLEMVKRLSRAEEEMAVQKKRRRRSQGELEARGERPRDTVDHITAMAALDAGFPRERTLVVDAGLHTLFALRLFRATTPERFVYAVNFGSIGFGVGYSIGAWFGAPQHPVLLVCGDGGLMLGGLSELQSAVRHKVNLVVGVFNDAAYGAEYVQMLRRGKDPKITTFSWPNFADVASSLGCDGLEVNSLSTLDSVVGELTKGQRERPLLIDIRTDAYEVSNSIT